MGSDSAVFDSEMLCMYEVSPVLAHLVIKDYKLHHCSGRYRLLRSVVDTTCKSTDLGRIALCSEVDEYIAIAKEKHGYNMEQALGMLFWHKHNIEKSLADLPNFTPFPDEWTVEDKVLFEQAFSFHGKTFHRIQQMLPDKSIASLVKFYYSWKKTRTKTSVMDRHARKQKREREE
ncbi:hypothetical protein E2320_021626, partial [Naja naja]